MASLRIIFMGTAELARPCLMALLGQPDFQLIAAVTQPDRPRGRALKLAPSPVKEAAAAAGLPVLQPLRARDETFIASVREMMPDLAVVVAYGQILPQSLLDVPRLGCLNVHTSLLPKHRGAAPIQWAILEGDAETGVTIMKMDAGLDTGPLLACRSTSIGVSDDSQSLHDRLAGMGAELLPPTIRDYARGLILPTPQPSGPVSYARKITKEDGRLDWTQPAQVLWNRIRAFTPWPGAFTHFPTPTGRSLLKIWRAEVADRAGSPGAVIDAGKQELLVACGRQALRMLEVQPEGGRRMTAGEFLRGHPLAPGALLADS